MANEDMRVGMFSFHIKFIRFFMILRTLFGRVHRPPTGFSLRLHFHCLGASCRSGSSANRNRTFLFDRASIRTKLLCNVIAHSSLFRRHWRRTQSHIVEWWRHRGLISKLLKSTALQMRHRCARQKDSNELALVLAVRSNRTSKISSLLFIYSFSDN